MAKVQKDFSESSQNDSRIFDGPTKKFLPKFDIFLPMFRKKIQNEKYIKETIPKTFFCGLVKISFNIPAEIFLQKSGNFCLLFEKNASMRNNFTAERFPQKTAQASESAGLQPVKEFLFKGPTFYCSNTENKHKLTTLPKISPPIEPADT